MVLILLAAGLELSKELLDSELMEPDDMPALMSAVDYVLTFLEEFTSQSAALTARHQRVLRSIVETAKKGVDKDLDSAIADCRSEIDSSFLLYLRDEAQRLEAIPGQASLSQLIRSIEGRAVEEIVRSTAEDADLISQLLLEGQKGLEHQTDAAKDMIRRKDPYGRQRFKFFVESLSEDLKKSETGNPELLSLVEVLENDVLPSLSTEESTD